MIPYRPQPPLPLVPAAPVPAPAELAAQVRQHQKTCGDGWNSFNDYNKGVVAAASAEVQPVVAAALPVGEALVAALVDREDPAEEHRVAAVLAAAPGVAALVAEADAKSRPFPPSRAQTCANLAKLCPNQQEN